jgi:hypothetical protein
MIRYSFNFAGPTFVEKQTVVVIVSHHGGTIGARHIYRVSVAYSQTDYTRISGRRTVGDSYLNDYTKLNSLSVFCRSDR